MSTRNAASGPSITSTPFRSPDAPSALSPSTSYMSRPSAIPSRTSRSSNYGGHSESTPSRQHTNGYAASSYRTPNPNLRHLSSASMVQSPSGESTPDYKRRAKKMADKGLIKEGERDWGNVEPDEVFRRLPVIEVRRVEGKMRQEALDKQSELRAMVGTRYRDLLTSATQISTLRTASLQLSDALRTVAGSCANADDIAITAETSTQVSDSEDVMTLLPAAAHMKLLLDAPEALYAYLGEGQVLRAAWLWLVARVVKEGMTSMGEASEMYHPLLIKQWEILVPFRAQIVQKATEKLRSRDKVETRTLAEILLTIILLDNLPISEALSLLLSQRTLALRDILAHPASSSPSSIEPITNKGKKALSPDPPSSAKERETIGSVLGTAVQCLLDTSESVRRVFDKPTDKPNPESLLEVMIRLVQKGEANPPTITQYPPTVRRNSSSNHTRRASRLVSISLPFTDPTSSSTSSSFDALPPISTLRIIQSLPSSQILLRHLPPSITGFTPFITPPQSPDLPTQLPRWQEDGMRILGEAAPAWLADLHTAQSVWGVRAVLASQLGQGEFAESIGKTLEDEWGKRAKGIWKAGLGNLSRTLEMEVGKAVEEIQVKASESDINPEKHVFAAITFPSIPSATLNIPNPVSFPTFMSGLKKRNGYRTPLLDRVLTILESLAKELQADVEGLPENLVNAYSELVSIGLEQAVVVLRRILDKLKEGDDGEKSVYAELLVGRISLFLARQSSFLSDLTGRRIDSSDPIPTSLIGLHTDSTSTWRIISISTALKHLDPMFDPLRGPREVKATWQGPHPVSPSSSILVALNSLVKSVRYLGIPPNPDHPEISVVRDQVNEFVEAAMNLEGWDELKDESLVQAVVDLGFLSLIRGGKIGEDEKVQAMLKKIPISYQSTFPQLLSPILAESLRRVQLLIYPLISHLPPTLTPNLDLPTSTPAIKRNGSLDNRAQLLRFGPPLGRVTASGDRVQPNTSSSTTEFRSPIAVAKPGKRFGLVNIAT